MDEAELGRARRGGHKEIKPQLSKHAKRFADIFTAQRKKFGDEKNAAPWHGLAAWPIVGWQNGPSSTPSPQTPQVSIAMALQSLISGTPDIFSYAVNPAQIPGFAGKTNAGGTTASSYTPVSFLGNYPVGQAPWNNFLSNSIRPFNYYAPEAIGIDWGVWGEAGDTTGLISALIEGTEIILYEQQNPTMYQPAFSMPGGVRLDRRVSQTQSSTYATTEGFGTLSARDLFEMPKNFVLSPEIDYHLILSPNAALKQYLAILTGPFGTTGESILSSGTYVQAGQGLTSNLIPIQGTAIKCLLYGSQLQPTGPKVSG